jgi:hypothetical protein
MSVWLLGGELAAALAVRVGFLLIHSRDADGLWYDFERRRLRFHIARLVDWISFLAFAGVAALALWQQDTKEGGWLGTFFVAWLGLSLLGRLQVHRFPRTNQPGQYRDAQVSLFTHVVVSLSGALAATGAAWLYFRCRG